MDIPLTENQRAYLAEYLLDNLLDSEPKSETLSWMNTYVASGPLGERDDDMRQALNMRVAAMLPVKVVEPVS